MSSNKRRLGTLCPGQ